MSKKQYSISWGTICILKDSTDAQLVIPTTPPFNSCNGIHAANGSKKMMLCFHELNQVVTPKPTPIAGIVSSPGQISTSSVCNY